jgi:RNA polymerase sigma-70 factor (ECF subfamily)
VKTSVAEPDLDALPDGELIARFRERDEAAVRLLTGRYNQRLFRVARSILRDEAEAEDVVQETYVRAFAGAAGFRGESSLATWLTRIAVNEALGRLRRRRPTVEWDADGLGPIEAQRIAASSPAAPRDPERIMADRQIHDLLEQSIDRLPDAFRAVFVARMVEGLSVEETADLFGLKPETVKTRVHRARVRLRRDLDQHLGGFVSSAFAFDGERCRRMTENVLSRLRDL